MRNTTHPSLESLATSRTRQIEASQPTSAPHLMASDDIAAGVEGHYSASRVAAGGRQAMNLEATHLRDRSWAVRPLGCCGTCGWVRGRAWSVIYVKATSAGEAINKARTQIWS